MEEITMAPDWRTVQLFVGLEGVSEVDLDAESGKKLRCTCASYRKASGCKHTKFVSKHMADNEGHYSIQVPNDVPDEDAILAMGNYEDFRQFIIKHAKVEVID